MNLRDALFVSLAIVFLSSTMPAFGAIWTVDDDGPADFSSIQAAIADAGTVNGDEIMVQPGVYIGAIDFLGKAVTLRSASGNPVDTVIDGDGAFHVVQCISGEDPNTVLEGFSITGGNAVGDSPEGIGAGMLNDGSSPTVTNCVFIGSAASFGGGGMYNLNVSNPMISHCSFIGNTTNSSLDGGGGMTNNNSSPMVTNCTFIGNEGGNYGGGMYNHSNGNPTVTDCTFKDNTASSFGGGMSNDGSSPTVTNCIFSGNSAHLGAGMWNKSSSNPIVTDCNFNTNTANDKGGGMHNDGSSPTVTNCNFTANSSTDGGGMYNNVTDSPMIVECTFSGNSATSDGGGIYNKESNPTVTHCKFIGNGAGAFGGGMFNTGNTPVTNCMFSGNTANNGGGMYNTGSSPTITNCTFSGNVAVGGGAFRNNNSGTTIINTVIWNNSPDGIQNPDPLMSVDNSDTQEIWVGAGSNNISDDPLFVDADGPDNIAGTIDDNLRLLLGSPCIDTGDNTAANLPATDLDDNARITDTTVDMGAYEFNDECDTNGVDDDAGPDGDGDGLPDSCDTPTVHNLTGVTDHFSIQDAINFSLDGDTIQIEPGTYKESIYFNARAITVTGLDPDDPNIVADTIICPASDYSVTFDFAEGPDSVLTGVTIINKGIYCLASTPTISKNVIRNCSTPGITGDFGAAPTITGNDILNNNDSGIEDCDGLIEFNNISINGYSDNAGGGLYQCDGLVSDNSISLNIAYIGGGLYSCHGTISSNTIKLNYANNGGGLSNCDGTIHDNLISTNRAGSSNGGGLGDCDATISYNIITNNTTIKSGGGLYNCDGAIIINNEISNNKAGLSSSNQTAYGGGLYNCENNTTIENNIISGNRATSNQIALGGGLYQCYNINNNIISGNRAISTNGIDNGIGGGLHSCSSIINNTITGNMAVGPTSLGGGIANSSNAIIKNNIIAFNIAHEGGAIDGSANNTYNLFWDNGVIFSNGAFGKIGDINLNPLFAVQGQWNDNGTPLDFSDDLWTDGDYHIQSTIGRWNPVSQSFVTDVVDSPGIDAGNPTEAINQELNPNGDRINVGAYGGTTEASLSPNGDGTPPTPQCVNPPQADMNGDCQVNFLDMTIFTMEWLVCGYDIQSACWQ